MKRIILLALVLALVAPGGIVAAQDDRYPDCEFGPTHDLLVELIGGADDWDALEAFSNDLAESLEFCRGVTVISSATGAKDNPIPLGQSQFIRSGIASVRVVNYIDNANSLVAQASTFNDPPVAGQRYVLFEVEYTCELDSTRSCEVFSWNFSAVGSTEVVHSGDDNIFVMGFENDSETFGGGTTTLQLPLLVSDTDRDLLLFYDDFGEDRVFFASE